MKKFNGYSISFALSLWMLATYSSAEKSDVFDIKSIQINLERLCYFPGQPDGKWGKNTLRAYKNFLSDRDEIFSGSVSSNHVELLKQRVKSLPQNYKMECTKSKGATVTKAQHALISLGYDIGKLDGVSGKSTFEALDSALHDRRLTNTKAVSSIDVMMLNTLVEERLMASSQYEDSVASQYNFLEHFKFSKQFKVPREYVFTNGKDTPKFEQYSVIKLFAHDLNNDQCDDLLIDFFDSKSEPLTVFGKKTHRFIPEKVFNMPKVRSIRSISKGDLNNDGISDLVAWTAPHDEKQKKLGKAWDRSEPELYWIINDEPKLTSFESYVHDGFIYDFDSDGDLDIVSIDEKKSSARRVLLNDAGEFQVSKHSIKILSNADLIDTEVADLNNDGLGDIVFAIQKPHHGKSVLPKDLTDFGTIAIAFSNVTQNINTYELKVFGEHWMSDADLSAFKLLNDVTGRITAGPSNITLHDYDNDGDFDIFQATHISNPHKWKTSGLKVYQNNQQQFSDVTDEVLPIQLTNKNLENPIEFSQKLEFVDMNSDGIKDLVVLGSTLDRMYQPKLSSKIYLFGNTKYLPVKFDHTIGSLGDIVFGDFNCDEKLDLISTGAQDLTTQELIFYSSR